MTSLVNSIPDTIWQAKLAAWIHDPAEKALVLLRDPVGHEGGTVKDLRREIFPQGVPRDLDAIAHRADRWAAAADRPQFPQGPGSLRWARVNFAEEPVITHPLSGQALSIRDRFRDLDLGTVKTASLEHFRRFIRRDPVTGSPDFHSTFLAFWRFGPDPASSDLGALWGLLPADTRIPDHTIWGHLDFTSALAGAMHADPDGQPALLTVTFGPVQAFIEQARSTSDLWAGSHLLSQMTWAGLQVLVDAVGPDAVVFPQLRGVPAVDLMLAENHGLDDLVKAQADWRFRSDSHPLFAAALPNRFVAVVPAAQARGLATRVGRAAREWVRARAREAFVQIVRRVGLEPVAECPGFEQIEHQLAEFPEVYWTAVPWSMGTDGRDGIDSAVLEKALAGLMRDGERAPFFASPAWRVLQDDIDLEGQRFYRPNPGILYPALYDLLERVVQGTKNLRAFSQSSRRGSRCTLCGEREWLTTDSTHLETHGGERQRIGTLWACLAEEAPSWARSGEHLCALCALKRLWPTLFVRRLQDSAVIDGDMRRYVVSTHTLALSTSLERLLRLPPTSASRLTRETRGLASRGEIQSLLESYGVKAGERASLPRKLVRSLDSGSFGLSSLVPRIPVLIDRIRDAMASEGGRRPQATRDLARVEAILKEGLGRRPEDYYALIQMDGDHMGAWLSGSDDEFTTTYAEAWHPRIQREVRQRENEALRCYLDSPRAASPARHGAVSLALNSFAVYLARPVVEDMFKGKLIYAGGDDLLAMVAVDDLVPCMLTLRLVYSGTSPGDDEEAWKTLLGSEASPLAIRNGYVFERARGRLHRLMGEKPSATASFGAVVAHHMAPLGMVLRELREAEKAAKGKGGRDAFCLRILKRSGGHQELVAPWALDTADLGGTPAGALVRLSRLLAETGVSRRAVYHSLEWLRLLPPKSWVLDAELASLVRENLARQFARQAGCCAERAQRASDMARGLVSMVESIERAKRLPAGTSPVAWLSTFMQSGEFLARSLVEGEA